MCTVQADNAPTCGVAEWVHSLAAQLSQAPQLAAYHQILSTDHQLRYRGNRRERGNI